jgi:hypothetical protein
MEPATDEEFALVYSIDETAAYGPGSGNGGAIWASKDKDGTPYDVSTRYSIAIDGEEMTAQRTSRGSYVWTTTVDNTWTSSTVLVTAYGAPGNYCSTSEWISTSTATTVGGSFLKRRGEPPRERWATVRHATQYDTQRGCRKTAQYARYRRLRRRQCA